MKLKICGLKGVDKSEISGNNDKFERTTNQHNFIEVQDEYASKATPGIGNITFDDGYNKKIHNQEISFADWLHNYYGGNIHLLSEANSNKVKSPDYIWNSKYWDLKTTTTEKAANSALRKGLKQIEDNPGGIMLDYGKCDISIENLIDVIEKRMKWYTGETIDIMIIRNGDVAKILRYKKRDAPRQNSRGSPHIFIIHCFLFFVNTKNKFLFRKDRYYEFWKSY